MNYVYYDSNNSGGNWWLKDKDWYNLEKAGWVVDWKKDSKSKFAIIKEGRWLGALATSAKRFGLSLEDAVAEFEQITGQDASAEGCNCCGQPHYFYERGEDDRTIRSPEIIKTTKLKF